MKKSETNSNTQPKEKKRPLSDGYAVGWSYLTETSESSYGFYYFYKEDSITVETSTVVVWARKYPMFPKGFAKRNEVTTPVDYSVEKIRFNCKDGNFYILNETLFDASGNSIDGKSGYRTVQTVVPGTLTETLQQRVCSVY